MTLALLPAAAGVSAASAWLAVRTGPAVQAPVRVPAVRSVAEVIPTEIPAGRELAAPATGVTGTVALAAPPAFTVGHIAPALGIAAPFSARSGSSVDRARAVECLTSAIYYEAASEPDAGQRAVAQVVLNRVRHPAFPATICGVVYQGSERRGCQFSFACDGAMSRAPSGRGWARAARNAAAALAGGVYAPVGLATHYHTFAVTPAWNRSLVMTGVVGAHFFHRWKGWWGTAAAFRQAYRGGEPVPGPHLPPAADVTAVAVPPAPPPAPDRPAPVLAPVSVPETPPPPADRLPSAPEILDRWKDSGKPWR